MRTSTDYPSDMIIRNLKNNSMFVHCLCYYSTTLLLLHVQCSKRHKDVVYGGKSHNAFVLLDMERQLFVAHATLNSLQIFNAA